MKVLYVLAICTLAVNSFAMRVKLSDQLKGQVVKVLQANEKLHGSFFSYKGKDVDAASKAMIAAISGIDKGAVKKDLSAALPHLKKIKSSAARAANNEAYAQASVFLVGVVNKYDVGNDYNNYSCPMVKKKWVQNSKKMKRTHNPYAPEMPHCGGRDTDY